MLLLQPSCSLKTTTTLSMIFLNFQAEVLSKVSKPICFLLYFLPVMMGASFYLSSFIQGYLDKTEVTSMIHLYSILPYTIVWTAFYIAYQLSANTQIKKRAALISSFIASLIWYLSKSGFVFYVMHNKTYTSVYGSI